MPCSICVATAVEHHTESLRRHARAIHPRQVILRLTVAMGMGVLRWSQRFRATCHHHAQQPSEESGFGLGGCESEIQLSTNWPYLGLQTRYETVSEHRVFYRGPPDRPVWPPLGLNVIITIPGEKEQFRQLWMRGAGAGQEGQTRRFCRKGKRTILRIKSREA